MALDPRAVRAANAKLWAAHPELKGRMLRAGPEDAAYRAEWQKHYQAAVAGGPKPPPPKAQPQAATKPPALPAITPEVKCPLQNCKIEVRANKLGSLGKDYHHLFIVHTDACGKETYLRGGPSAGGPSSSGMPSELSGGSSDNSSGGSSGSGSNPSSATDSSGGGDGPFGNIDTVYGAYEPGTIDWDPDAKSTVIESGPAACGKLELLKKQMDAIAASKTRYNPIGPNSNTVVFQAIKNVGLEPQVPEGVWAPGKDMSISTE